MRAKMLLVLAVAGTMMFSEGCALSIPGMPNLGGAAGAPQSPLGTTDPAALAAGLTGQQGNPLTGALAGTLPQDPGATVPGLTTQPPTFTPASPTSTPVDPNASTPQAVAGIPQATPVGTGPIDPASLPTIPAAAVNNTSPLALAGTLPQPAGL